MDERSASDLGRRRVLTTMAAVASATSLAGCSSFLDRGGVGDSGAADVTVHNAASEPKTVSVTITDADAEEPHTDRTLELSAGENVDSVNSGKLPTNTSSYTVEVGVENGPSETFTWTDPTVQRAPLWVLIDGTRNIKFLLQAG